MLYEAKGANCVAWNVDHDDMLAFRWTLNHSCTCMASSSVILCQAHLSTSDAQWQSHVASSAVGTARLLPGCQAARLLKSHADSVV